MRPMLLLGAMLLMTGCGDGAGPVTIGTTYQLRRVNGQPMPWSTPPDDSAFIPTTIADGWIKFVDGAQAQRHERAERRVLAPSGDSMLVLVQEWTSSATYWRVGGKIFLAYIDPVPGRLGPEHMAETLYVTRAGGLVLRETGYVPPLDSVIRLYCSDGTECP